MDFIIDRFDGAYRFLSNFYPCVVEYKGVQYPSVENAYQAAKFLDANIREKFLVCPPGIAKRKARHYRADLRPDWDDVKVTVMAKLLSDKFINNPDGGKLGDLLVNTGASQLVEGNTWGDTFWGVCDGKGENMLGVLLMQTRDRLCAQRGLRR